MKKIALVLGLVVAAASLTGCAGRPLNSQDRAAILGASMGAALSNAHDAAFGQGVYREQEHRDQADNWHDTYGHKHHRRGTGDYHPWDRQHDELSTDTVRKNGKLGYYDAYGKFHAY